MDISFLESCGPGWGGVVGPLVTGLDGSPFRAIGRLAALCIRHPLSWYQWTGGGWGRCGRVLRVEQDLGLVGTDRNRYEVVWLEL